MCVCTIKSENILHVEYMFSDSDSVEISPKDISFHLIGHNHLL